MPSGHNIPKGKALGDWVEVDSPDGTYYYHKLTRAVRWERPEGAVAEKMSQRIWEEEEETRRRQAKRKEEMADKEKSARRMQEEKLKVEKKVISKVQRWANGKSLPHLLQSLHELIPDKVGEIKGGLKMDTAPSKGQVKKAYMQVSE